VKSIVSYYKRKNQAGFSKARYSKLIASLFDFSLFLIIIAIFMDVQSAKKNAAAP
jgi:hypothetical protein